jgi:bacteriorhodopsin
MMSRWTAYLSMFCLLVVLIIQIVFLCTRGGETDNHADNIFKYEFTGALVCFIALMHYLLIIVTPDYDTMIIRYSDWILTLPLLLYKILLIRNVKVDENIIWCICLFGLLMLMLWSGWKSERLTGHKWTGTMLIGFISLLGIYLIVFNVLESPILDTLQIVTIIFFLMWILYGVVASGRDILKKTTLHTAYDVLDLSTKAIFGVLVVFTITFVPSITSSKIEHC